MQTPSPFTSSTSYSQQAHYRLSSSAARLKRLRMQGLSALREPSQIALDMRADLNDTDSSSIFHADVLAKKLLSPTSIFGRMNVKVLAYAFVFALVILWIDYANAAVITRTTTIANRLQYVRTSNIPQRASQIPTPRTTFVPAPPVQPNNSTRRLPDLELNVDAILSTLTVTTGQVSDGLQCALDEGCLHPGAGWFSNVRLLRFDTNTTNIGTADFRPPDAANPVWHECHAHFHGFEKYANYYITRAGEGQVLVTGHKASFCLMDSGCRPGVASKYGSCRIDNQGISVGCWDAYTADLDCQWVDITQLPAGTYDLRVVVNEGRHQPELLYNNNAATVRFTYSPDTPGSISNKSIVRQFLADMKMLAYVYLFAFAVARVGVANAAVITSTVTIPPAPTTYVPAPTMYVPAPTTYVPAVPMQAGNSTQLLPDLELNVDAILSTLTVTNRQVSAGLQCALDEGCLQPGAGWFSNVRLLGFDTNTANIGNADFRPPDAANPVWHECHGHFHGFEKYANYYITRPGEGQVLVTGHKASFCLLDSGCRPGVVSKYGSCRIDNQGISVGCWDNYTGGLDCQWVDITQLPAGTYDLRVVVNEGRHQPELRYDNNEATVRFTYSPETPGFISNKSIIPTP